MKGLTSKICYSILVYTAIFFGSGFKCYALYKGVEDKSLFERNIDSLSGTKVISEFLNQFIASENDPKILINAAYFIRSTHKYGIKLSNDAANFLLQRATQIIEDFKYNTNLFKAIAYRRMAKQLQEQGVPIDIPLSNFKKLVINLKQKNYHYLFSRLQLQIKSIITNSFINHKVVIAGSVFILAIFICFQIKKRRYFYPVLFILFCSIVGLLFGFSSETHNLQSGSFQGAMFNFQMGEEIGASRIFNERQIPVGKIIWINEDNVGFNYHFSPLNISSFIDSISKNNQLLLSSTASFVNSNVEPVGFTACSGTFLNPMIHRYWDGLALITDNNIQVISLNLGNISNPVTNFESYFQLTSQVRNNRSDVFQLPLLIFNDSLLFKTDKASCQLRENRFLLKVTSPGKKKIYLVADIENAYPLYYNALAFFSKLKSENYSIQFMVLLDVGANNFLQVYNPDGIKNNHYRSLVPAEKANNVLTIKLLKKCDYSMEL
jgi:hypothetical protein